MNASKSSGGIFDLAQRKARIDEIDAISAAPGFWDDADTAQKYMQERGELVDLVENFTTQFEALDEVELYSEMAADGEASAEGEALALLDSIEAIVRTMETQRMLGGPQDNLNAFLQIKPGAGGTDSQDWAEMLFRMYSRFCADKGWKVEVTDYDAGQEAGIKAAGLHVQGRHAYGLLKAEQGVHRLVRISPYGKGRRETSFAALRVTPEIDDDIDIEVLDSDLKVDTYRASGAGGQHVNKTDSAIRITHVPTGTVVQCQNERSQHKNRATAMKMLKSALYQMELAKREAEAQASYQDLSDVAFGSQIRSYVLHPYKQIKDLRSGYTVSNVDKVLDGDLDGFIEAFLLMDGSEGDEAN